MEELLRLQFVIAIAAQLHVGFLAVTSASEKHSYAVSFRGWSIGVFMLVTYLMLWIRLVRALQVHNYPRYELIN